ncbi:unnamed protein product [Pseudomonas phage phiCTX]|uniref:DNA, complete genome n=1 Tax=Pseudomonas phage phiCTX TaxID=2993857 RepID=Q9ZXJ0_9CAUD|nr:hypothetical protein phiCTXp38 [Pseudomonas phage phiCTX]BAA36263.1 unnamed protein product [Pseudomonas phage phiCTX]
MWSACNEQHQRLPQHHAASRRSVPAGQRQPVSFLRLRPVVRCLCQPSGQRPRGPTIHGRTTRPARLGRGLRWTRADLAGHRLGPGRRRGGLPDRHPQSLPLPDPGPLSARAPAQTAPPAHPVIPETRPTH